jgi:hypothetical protein
MHRTLNPLAALGLSALVAACFGGSAPGAINHPVPGIYGRITASPTCPVERSGEQCAPRGVAARVNAESHHRVVASTRSNSAGDYAMGLRPGSYTLVVNTGSTFPRCPAKAVTVPKSRSVRADIGCDTGIR